jgi:hypothetical protein
MANDRRPCRRRVVALDAAGSTVPASTPAGTDVVVLARGRLPGMGGPPIINGGGPLGSVGARLISLLRGRDWRLASELRGQLTRLDGAFQPGWEAAVVLHGDLW